MKKLIITLSIPFALFVGCKSKTNLPDTTAAMNAQWNTIAVNTKGNPLSLADKPLIYIENGIEYYSNYNHETNSLNLYCLNSNVFSRRISFSSSGPNKISGLAIYNFYNKSIISQNIENIERINFEGEIVERLQLIDIYPELDTKYCLKGNVRMINTQLKRLFLDRNSGSILLRTYNKENGYEDIYRNPVFVEYNYITGQGVAHNVIFPKEVSTKHYGDLEYPNIISKGDSIIYNFPFKAAVYIYNKKTKQTEVKEYSAQHIPSIVWGAELSEKSNLMLMLTFIQGDKYHQIDYDPYKRLYYILYSEKKLEDLPSKQYLIVFDETLKKVGEVEIDPTLSPSYAISSKGLLFRNTKDDSFDTLTLHVLNVEVEKK